MNNEKLVMLNDMPQSSAGSPSPILIGDEHTLLLAYYIHNQEQALSAGDISTGAGLPPFVEQVAIVDFRSYYWYSFGCPNDEALSGHPLYAQGLESYAAFEAQDSFWIKELHRRNSIHDSHNPKEFELLHHYVFTFHDSTFECVAKGYEVTRHQQSISALLPSMIDRLT